MELEEAEALEDALAHLENEGGVLAEPNSSPRRWGIKISEMFVHKIPVPANTASRLLHARRFATTNHLVSPNTTV